MAALDHELRVRAQEMRGHGHAAPIRQHEPGTMPELLDETEDVVPAPAVEPDDRVAQLVEDLVDLECGRDRLDQDRDLDRPGRQPERPLGMRDDVRPEPRLEPVLQLGKVEVRPGSAPQELRGVLVQVQAEIHERAGDRLVAVQPVLLGQVPAARPYHQDRGLLVEPVGLALGRRERQVAAHGSHQVRLPLDEVGPGRAQGILEVRHEDVRAGVQRVDDHLALGRARDLDAPVHQVLRDRADAPVRGAQRPRFFREVRQLAGLELALPGFAPREQPGALVRERSARPLTKAIASGVSTERHSGSASITAGCAGAR